MSTEPVHLFLTYDFPPLGGGIARWASELARRYPPGGLVVSTGRMPGSEAVDAALPNRVDRISTPARRLRTIQGLVRWSRRTVALCRREGVSFNWCGNLRPAAYPARWALARTGTPYGVLVHGHDLLVTRRRAASSRAKRWTVRTLLGDAALLVANSEATRDMCLDLLDHLGLPADRSRVRVVPLGADPERFRPGLDAGPVWRRYGLPQGRWLVTVARFVVHKGIDTAIRVLAELEPDVRYLVIGSGEGEAGLRALARELGVADRVHFLTAVPDADVPLLLNGAEIYLGLSRVQGLMIEGFGIALTEASACGLPVIAGKSGGTSDAVRDGETGLVVPADDASAPLAAVRRLLEDRETARRLGTAGRRAVETFYNWDRVTRDLRDLAREAVAASGAGPGAR